MAYWANDYVGIPYKVSGRDRNGCDCWGLVTLVLREHYKIELPLFDGLCGISIDESARLIDVNRPLIDAYVPDVPRESDIVLLKIRNMPCHVGLYLGGGLMLHTLFEHDSAIERVDSPKWAKRIEGFYRVQ